MNPARLAGGALVFLLSFPLPALAGGPAPGLAGAAQARVAAMPRAALAQAAGTPAPESGRSFVGTPKGKLALVLLAGALGYTFHSFTSDRVKSPAK